MSNLVIAWSLPNGGLPRMDSVGGALSRKCRPRLPALTATALGLLLAACAGRHPSPTSASTQPAFRRVVLITLDTLRADHLGAYGYSQPTSPFIDSLAARGVTFDNAIAPSASTSPSHATLMTGRYPLEHGVRKNGHLLAPAIPTLADRLTAEGFATAAFVGTDRHFGSSGIARGFSLLDEPSLPPGPSYRPAASTIDVARTWVAARAVGEPFLLWVHLFDPHAPNRPEPALRRAVRPRDAEGERRFLDRLLSAGVRLESFRGSEQRLLKIFASYDGEILALDRAVEALYRTFERGGLLDGSVWVLVADHGEGLGSHGVLAHGVDLYGEAVRVPLIVHDPSGRLAPRRLASIVEHTDLLPSVLDLLGVRRGPSGSGESWVHLLTRGDPPRRDRLALVQRREYTERASRSTGTATFAEPYEAGEKFALRSETWSYIWRSDGRTELFDLVRDPHETVNLAGRGLPQERELHRSLTARIRQLRRTSMVTREVDEETVRRLESLGYLR